MLINFNYIVQKYGLPKGIIHIGAHMMEERHEYLSYGLNNTIWCEANSSLFGMLNVITEGTLETVFPYAISDVSGDIIDFKITNNGQSSSILDLDKHKIHHPEVYVINETKVMTKRMDDIIVENSINIESYNFINLDIQGAELLALKGFGDLLSKIDFIYTEVNTDSIYKECALLSEIDSYLSDFGFDRKEIVMTPNEWGDAFYVKLK